MGKLFIMKLRKDIFKLRDWIGAIQQFALIRTLESAEGRRRTLVIALAASAMAGDPERFLASSMDGCLAKPFDAEDLNEILQTLIRPVIVGPANLSAPACS